MVRGNVKEEKPSPREVSDPKSSQRKHIRRRDLGRQKRHKKSIIEHVHFIQRRFISSLFSNTGAFVCHGLQKIKVVMAHGYERLPEMYIAILAFGLYINTFNNEFVWDDRVAILRNRDVIGATDSRPGYTLNDWLPLGDMWTHDYWGADMHDRWSHKSYRPATIYTFRLNYLMSEARPFWYHVFNAGLHSMNTLLVFWIANAIVFSRDRSCKTLSGLSGILFAIHPIHCDAVTSIVGRADLLATFWGLLGVWTYYSSLELTYCNTTDSLPRIIKGKVTGRSLFFLSILFLCGV